SSARAHCGLGLTPSFAESPKQNTGSVPGHVRKTGSVPIDAKTSCANRLDPVLSESFPPPGVIEDWAAWLHVEDDPDAVDRIRRQTNTGRPCGGSRFMAQLENLMGRALRPAKRGRKPKAKAKARKVSGNS